MPQKEYKALVAGGSGLVGSFLLTELLANPAYKKVNALVRRPLHIENPKLETIITDFKDFDNHDKAFAVDHVYICLGTTIKKAKSKKAFRKVDLEYPILVAKKAHEMGAKRVSVISSIGADVESTFFYSRVKGMMENEISNIPFKGTHILRPSLLLGPRKEYRFGEKMSQVANEVFKHVLLGSLSKYKGIKAEKVAKAMMLKVLEGKKGIHTYESDEIRKIAKGKV